MNHGLEHLGRGYDTFSEHTALADQILLNRRHFHARDFDSEISTGNHDTIGNLTDFFNVLHTRTVLNLCNNINIFAAVLVKEFTHILDIFLYGDERCCNEIHVVFDTKQQVFLILLTQKCMIHDLVRKIHALFIRHLASDKNLTDGIRCFQLFYFQNNQTIVDQDMISHLQIVDQILVGYGNSLLISHNIIRCQCKCISIF